MQSGGGYVGTGLKKPLNQYQNPIYPNIQAALPQWKWAGKWWQVDQGRALVEASQIPEMIDSSVLVQNKDYNSQFAYGVSSHRTYVNENFRPPLIDRDDTLPLSRIPRYTVVPRMNPGLAHDTGSLYYPPLVIPDTAPTKQLQENIKQAEARPTFYAPMDTLLQDGTMQNSINIRDIDKPNISASAGYKGHLVNGEIRQTQLDNVLPPVSVSAGFAAREIPSSPIDLVLENKSVPVSATAGFNYSDSGLIPQQQDYDFDDKYPQVSVSSGINSIPTMDNQWSNIKPNVIDIDPKLSPVYNVVNPTFDYQVENYRRIDNPQTERKKHSAISGSAGMSNWYRAESAGEVGNPYVTRTKIPALAAKSGYDSGPVRPGGVEWTARVAGNVKLRETFKV